MPSKSARGKVNWVIWGTIATIILAVVGVLGLLHQLGMLRIDQSVPEAKNSGNNPVDSPSFIEHYQTLKRLNDRFMEKEEYIKSLENKTVEWFGYVDDISSDSQGGADLVFFPTKDKNPPIVAVTAFDKSWKEKLYALRKQDFVRVRGVIKKADNLMVILEGISAERIETQDNAVLRNSPDRLNK